MVPSASVDMGRPVKHSLTLQRHRTSVTLEDEFWSAFRDIASEQKRVLNDLASEIDADRDPGIVLATAIRLYVLRHYQSQI